MDRLSNEEVVRIEGLIKTELYRWQRSNDPAFFDIAERWRVLLESFQEWQRWRNSRIYRLTNRLSRGR